MRRLSLRLPPLSNVMSWDATDWESEASHVAFIKSPHYVPFLAAVGEVFDLDVAAPVMSTTRGGIVLVAARYLLI